MNRNLNDLRPDNDGNYSYNYDRTKVVTSGDITAHFDGLFEHLISYISNADAVFGCVAWMTHPMILTALAEKQTAIVVQKEDFLRPDLGAQSRWKHELRRKYESLSCDLVRYDFGNAIGNLSVCYDPTVAPVRCVGNYNQEKAPAFPRMHHKFLVFSKLSGLGAEGQTLIEPYAVWTGSFNLTLNATASMENALYITNKVIISAYFDEFAHVFALSEPLDWEHIWCEPEYRIGT